jgi:hypothetical protein
MTDLKNADGERDRGPFGLERKKERHQIGIHLKIGKGSLKNHIGPAEARAPFLGGNQPGNIGGLARSREFHNSCLSLRKKNLVYQVS